MLNTIALTSTPFGSSFTEVPEALLPRSESHTMLLVGIFALSFLFLSVARLFNGKSFATVSKAFFQAGPVDQLLKENMRIGSMSSVLLVVNFAVAAQLCAFLVCNRVLSLDLYNSLLLSIAFPIAMLFYESFGLIMTGMFTGEGKVVEPAILNTWVGFEFTGLGLSVLSLVWIMNPEFNKICLGVFIAIMALRVLQRFIKNSLSALLAGVSWYYLILYLCTLEILPLFVVYFYVKLNFHLMI